MLSFLPSSILFVISSILLAVNTSFWAFLIFIGGVIKFLMPIKLVRSSISKLMDKFMWAWATGNGGILQLTSKIEWHVEGLEHLNKNGWYLIISNHLSGLDIAVTTYILRNHIPMLKFFLKKELLYVPFLGLGCWALGMPFMDRTSPQKLKKNPKLKGKDLRTTSKACEKFRHVPTSIMNYVEGSRFTEEKRQRQNSPYRYLLKPKAGGIAFTLSAMGKQFSNLLNMTIVYPNAPENILASALKGQVTRVVIKIEMLPVPHINAKDYFENNAPRIEFQRWLNQLWQDKDEVIHQVLLENHSAKQDML